MTDPVRRRRKRLAALIVLLPVVAGLAIAALSYFLGDRGPEIGPHPQPRNRVEAATPVEPGSPAPRIRLTAGGSGRRFDGASLDGEPYAVVFISARCGAIGGFLRRAAADLEPGEAAVLAISADPAVDSLRAVRHWLSDNRLKPGGRFHFLIGDERELRPYWHAWGFSGPSSACPDSVPVHLVGTSKGTYFNAGILDIAPKGAAETLTLPLRAMDRRASRR